MKLKRLSKLLLVAGIFAFCPVYSFSAPMVGVSAIYVTDLSDLDDEVGVMARIGLPLAGGHSDFNHGIELEVGWVSPSVREFGLDFDLEIIPIQVNYRFETFLGKVDNLKLYLGAGLGLSYVDLEVEDSFGNSISDDDTPFTWQIFVGLGYGVAKNATVIAGYRYLYIDDTEFFGLEDELGGSNVWEVGINVGF